MLPLCLHSWTLPQSSKNITSAFKSIITSPFSDSDSSGIPPMRTQVITLKCTYIIQNDLPILRSFTWSHLLSPLFHTRQYIHRFWGWVHGNLSLSSLPQCMQSSWQKMSHSKINSNNSNESLLNTSLDYQFSMHSLQQELESSQLVIELIIGINKL